MIDVQSVIDAKADELAAIRTEMFALNTRALHLYAECRNLARAAGLLGVTVTVPPEPLTVGNRATGWRSRTPTGQAVAAFLKENGQSTTKEVSAALADRYPCRTVRTVLSTMVAEGSLVSPRRGVYDLGEMA